MRHDEAFKLLLSEMPEGILHAFADDVAQAWGDPGKVTVETVEVLPRVKGLRRSRYFDLAVQLRWPDGRRVLILLTEHFSHGKDVDLPRVALYTTALMQRHPGIPVLPVVVIGQGGGWIKPSLTSVVAGQVILDFHCRILALDRDLLQLWERTHAPILAVLAALLRDLPGPQTAFRACRMLRASRDGDRLLSLALPLIQHLANLTAETTPAFHELLTEDETMTNIIELIQAKGKAEGKAEMALALLRRQLVAGRLTIDGARVEVEAMRQAGELADDAAAQVLAALG